MTEIKKILFLLSFILNDAMHYSLKNGFNY